jgi:hypothetical protein
MLIALKYLGLVTEQVFEWQMRRAAIRIGARQHLFPHHRD